MKTGAWNCVREGNLAAEKGIEAEREESLRLLSSFAAISSAYSGVAATRLYAVFTRRARARRGRSVFICG